MYSWMPTRAGAMLANVPSSQVVLSQLKFPAAWHSYFTASPSEDVVECLQVSSRFLFGHIVASDAMHAGDEQRVWGGRVQAVYAVCGALELAHAGVTLPIARLRFGGWFMCLFVRTWADNAAHGAAQWEPR